MYVQTRVKPLCISSVDYNSSAFRATLFGRNYVPSILSTLKRNNSMGKKGEQNPPSRCLQTKNTRLTRIKNCRFSADCGLLRLVENEASDAHGLALPQDAGVLGDRGVIKGLTLSIPDPADNGTLDDSKKLNSPAWRAAFGGVPTAFFTLPWRNLPLPTPPNPPAPGTSQPPPALPVLLTLLSTLPLLSASTPRDEVSPSIPSFSDGSTVLDSSSLSNTNTVLLRCPSPHRTSPVHPAYRPPAAPVLPRPAAQAFNLLGDGVCPNGD